MPCNIDWFLFIHVIVQCLSREHTNVAVYSVCSVLVCFCI